MAVMEAETPRVSEPDAEAVSEGVLDSVAAAEEELVPVAVVVAPETEAVAEAVPVLEPEDDAVIVMLAVCAENEEEADVEKKQAKLR